MATVAHVKKLFWGNDSDETVDLSIVKQKNAQIGEQVYVDGVLVQQDGNGAPVEQVSPLGYHVGWAGILFLNVSQMVGTGVFSTRKSKVFSARNWKTDEASSGWDSSSFGFRWLEHLVLDLWFHHCSWYVCLVEY